MSRLWMFGCSAVVLVAAIALPPSPGIAEPAPRLVFSPALGVPQAFRVSYRLRDVTVAGAMEDQLGVDPRLTVTPIARETDGYRLRLLVSDVERPRLQGMDMVVAAAMMLDGFPFEMLVDARGFLKEASDWPELQRKLMQRLGTQQDISARMIGFSVIDHDSRQVAWHLARALEKMNFANSYLASAERTGASTISWYGSPIDITVEPPNADGAVAITWASPSSEGHALIRQDGFAAPLKVTSTPAGTSGRTKEVFSIEAVAP